MPMRAAAVSASMTSTWPSSLRLTEAMAGARHARTAATRALTSGTIHAPVETPTATPGHAACTARTASSTASVSRPSAPRGWMCSAWAPAAIAAAPSMASCAGVSGSARCSSGARAPFRQALIRARTPSRGARSRARAYEVVERHALVDRVRALEPAVPAIAHGDPARGEEAHVGAVGHAGGASRGPSSAVERRAHARDPRVVGRRLAGGELPAGPARSTGASPSARLDRGLERRARRRDGASPTRTPARGPRTRSRSGTGLDHSPAVHAADEQRVGQLELAHQRVLDVGVERASCAGSAAWSGT